MLEEPPLIALAQTLLHTLDDVFKEPFIGIVADPVDARVFSPDSSHQLTIRGVSPLPLPGCSSRDHRHTDLSFCLGTSFHPRPGNLGDRGDPTRSAVCSMVVVNAVSTSSTLLPLGGNAPRWTPITVATSWRRWGSFFSRRRSIGGGPFAFLTGWLRPKRPSSFTCGVMIL